jgi:hypothetical protein
VQNNKYDKLADVFKELFPAFRFNLLREKLFLQGFAGTSVGRSAKPTKNSFSLKRISTSIGAKNTLEYLSILS